MAVDTKTDITSLDLTKHSEAELIALQERIHKELSSRSEYDAEFKLSASKVYKGASPKQIALAEDLAKKTNSSIKPTKSQVMKYMDIGEMSEAIDLMMKGKRIKIS
jgi:hypothetical protein